ncbi:MAG: hypothetical protein WA988_09680 [Candidatus Nanopelagicales bacterium]
MPCGRGSSFSMYLVDEIYPLPSNYVSLHPNTAAHTRARLSAASSRINIPLATTVLDD